MRDETDSGTIQKVIHISYILSSLILDGSTVLFTVILPLCFFCDLAETIQYLCKNFCSALLRCYLRIFFVSSVRVCVRQGVYLLSSLLSGGSTQQSLSTKSAECEGSCQMTNLRDKLYLNQTFFIICPLPTLLLATVPPPFPPSDSLLFVSQIASSHSNSSCMVRSEIWSIL